MVKQTKTTEDTLLERKLEVEHEREANDSRAWWWVCAAVGAVIFLAGAYIAHKHTVSGINLSLFRTINNWPNSLKALFLIAIVSSNSLWIAIATLCITTLLKLYTLTWQLAAAIIAAAGSGFIAKAVINQPRPYALIADIHRRASDADPSYPSGHVLIVTVIVVTLWPYLPKGWRWLIAMTIPLMGIARIYLGVHTPVDVLGGFGLSLAVVSVMRILPEAIRRPLHLD